MLFNRKLRTGASRFARAAMAGALALGMAPVSAFADDLVALQVQADAMDTEGYVIAAAYAAANPAPEILGLNNPNQRSDAEAEQTYNFFGDTDINENADPYLWNNHNGKTPGIYIGGRAGSPMSRLNAYNAEDPTAAQNAVWELMPHIILGTGSDTIEPNEHDFYLEDAKKVETALNLDEGTYKPIGVTYNRTTLPTMIQTMYRLAAAANEVTEADESLDTRYEDPMEIARDYERYIVGQKGLVKQAIDAGTVSKKTIALVSNYDTSSSTYTIITDGVAEGTATTNRYLEAVQGVADNYFSKVAESGQSATVTAEQLKQDVDVIIVGGQASMDSSELARYLQKDGLLGKTFYCVNWANGSAFGTTVNSVENAQNIGRILPCVYPEVLDQSDMIAYYYDVFYHIKDGEIARIVGERMDGVRNWDNNDSAAYTNWDASDVAGYNHDDVEALLMSGVSYLNSQQGQSSYLTPTNNVEQDSADLKDTIITISAGVLENGKAEPEPIVVYGGKTLVKDVDYTVEWSNNTTVGQNGTVTITAKDGTSYVGSKEASFKVIAATNFTADAIGVAFEQESYQFTGATITPDPIVTLKDSGAVLTAGQDYVVSYSDNRNVGEATATLTGIGDYSGTLDAKFAITKGVQQVSISAATDNAIAKTFGDEPFQLFASTTGDGALTFTSSDPSVAEVDELGTVIIKKAGAATITVSAAATDNCDSATAEAALTVAKLGKQTVTIGALGRDREFSKALGDAAFALDASTTGDGALSYESSDTAVATVNESGQVTIVGAGETTLTVSAAETDNAGAGQATAKLTVAKSQTVITAEDVSKVMGDEAFSIATVTEGYDGTISYATSNEAVATVDASGKVTIVGAGEATISVTAPATAKYEAAEKAVKVSVSPKAQSITGTASYSKTMGDTAFTLDAKALGNAALTYKSSNDNVATVDADGKVTIVGAGSAKITVSAAATTEYSAAEKVIDISVGEKAQVITASNKSVAMGKTVALNAKANGGGALSYKTSNAKVAKVSAKGVVTPVKVGSATITITAAAKGAYSKATKTIKVTVKQGKQSLTFAKQSKKVKLKSVKKAKQTVAITKAKGAKTKVSYSIAKVSKSKKQFSINAKTGKITVKKGTAKGTYKVTVKATAAKNANWAKASKNAVITITVK